MRSNCWRISARSLPDERQITKSAAQPLGRQSSNVPPKRESHEVRRRASRQDGSGQPLHDGGRDAAGNQRLFRQGRIAQPRQIRRDDLMARLQQRGNRLEPVVPGARTAVQQHDRLPRPPAPPDHLATTRGGTAWRPDDPGLALDGRHGPGRRGNGWITIILEHTRLLSWFSAGPPVCQVRAAEARRVQTRAGPNSEITRRTSSAWVEQPVR